MKTISILGSTGTIGLKTLEIVRSHPREFRVRGLAAYRNVERLAEQIREFKPEMACLYDAEAARELKKRFSKTRVKILAGDEGLEAVSTLQSADQVICAMVGAAGLKPIFAALRAGKSLGIANKEPLVIAGKLLMQEAARRGVPVMPIDSEHSGIWQCLEQRNPKTVKRLILTSSGGPFRTRKGSFSGITVEHALNHPKWKMGPKITIDSATLMNKGLEVIEAVNLFQVPAEKVDVLIHPEAIIHAMIEFTDGSYLAHLGAADMRLPIQYALSYPARLDNHLPTLDMVKIGTLSFEKPDKKRFPCLALGYEASRLGGTMPAALNAANEVAVDAFLKKEITFMDIPRVIERVMTYHTLQRNPSLDELLWVDDWARREGQKLIQSLKGKRKVH